MKKIFKILLILFLFLSCYLIYSLTENDKIFYVSIGNKDSFNNQIIERKNIEYNNLYVDKDYRIVDLINIIKYNEEKDVSIHYLLNKADVLTVFIGMNELYNILNSNTREIYQYINDIVIDMDNLLNEISRYNYEDVYVLGFYNVFNNYNDIFTYINYKINKVVNKYNYTYIELNKIINKYDLIDENNFELNQKGIDKISKIILAYLEKA